MCSASAPVSIMRVGGMVQLFACSRTALDPTNLISAKPQRVWGGIGSLIYCCSRGERCRLVTTPVQPQGSSLLRFKQKQQSFSPAGPSFSSSSCSKFSPRYPNAVGWGTPWGHRSPLRTETGQNPSPAAGGRNVPLEHVEGSLTLSDGGNWGFGGPGGDPAPVNGRKAQHLLVVTLIIYRSSEAAVARPSLQLALLLFILLMG